MFAIVHVPDEKRKPNLHMLQKPVFPEKNFFRRECFERAFSGCMIMGISLSGHAEMTAR